MAANIYDWSRTAGDNDDADTGINWAEGQAPSTVNNSARTMMKRLADFIYDIGGSNSAGGTADALTLTTGNAFAAYANGQIIAFKATASNTGAATINVNSIGAKAIRYMSDSGDAALSANMIRDTGIYVAQYSTAYNSSAGGWLLLNPTLASDIYALAAAWTSASSSGAASLAFAEDTDNGSHAITLKAPASVAANADVELPGVAGTLATLAGTETFTNKTLTTPAITDPVITGAIKEDVYTISDGAGFEIDPGNGSVQTITLGASRTPAATNFADGESVTLRIADGSAFAITWTTVGVVWVGGSAPTLATSGYTIVELWKIGSTIYGAHVGDVAS